MGGPQRQKGCDPKGGRPKGKNKDQKGGKNTQSLGRNRYRSYGDWWQTGENPDDWANYANEWTDNTDKSQKTDNSAASVTVGEKVGGQLPTALRIFEY